MAEIAENLHRRDIGEIERAELTAKWGEVTKLRSPPAKIAQDAQFSKVGAGRGNKGGVSQTARDLGMTRDQVSRAVKIASLSPEAKEAAKSSGLDNNQSALLAAAKHKEPTEPYDKIRLHEAWQTSSEQSRTDFYKEITSSSQRGRQRPTSR